ncbi:2-amino-4-hydroxy-6-hydroxymethyldihydropteridine diphosphokinase [Aulosira sp. FACHB-615]|nr:2-amino-4-hydroxy-6-hydroxymethyldihydropteridine diphosphokinase [Aulosira sp. FACHB-615]
MLKVSGLNGEQKITNHPDDSGREFLSSKEGVQIAVALGSNLGDSWQILTDAIAKLSAVPNMQLTATSSWYKTKAVGPPQPDYINGCIIMQVNISPQGLLETLLAIEQQFGRVRQERWGPRSLDLDLLLYDQVILDTPNLQIPHPRMRERAFVLVPLAEIAPDWIEPVSGYTIKQLVKDVDCSDVHLLKSN